jgi:hypothetical protein
MDSDAEPPSKYESADLIQLEEEFDDNFCE